MRRIPSITSLCLTRATAVLISQQFSGNSRVVKNKRLDILNLQVRVYHQTLLPLRCLPISVYVSKAAPHKMPQNEPQIARKRILLRENNGVPTLPLIRALFFSPPFPFFAAAFLESLLIAVRQVAKEPRGNSVVPFAATLSMSVFCMTFHICPNLFYCYDY